MNNIYQSMAAVMADVDAIGKNKFNEQQKFKFRGIDDVYNTIHPILAKHGVFTVPTVMNERTEERVTKNGGNLIYRVLTIQYTFYAADGTSVQAVVIGEGMDSGDKAANKAMAVGHKYALLQVLCIPTEDMPDPDAETPGNSTKATTTQAPVNTNTFTAKAEPVQVTDTKPEPSKGILRIGLLPEQDFNPKEAYGHLLSKADGDKDFLGGVLNNLGAYSTKDITHAIYTSAMKYLNMRHGNGAAEK